MSNVPLWRKSWTLCLQIVLWASLSSVSAPSLAVLTVHWDQTVIPLQLVVGVEQMVRFEGPASVGVPAGIADPDVFRQLFANETAYWLAMAPFERARIKVRLEETGTFVLFDVSAVTHKKPPMSVEPITVVTPSPARNRDSADAQGRSSTQGLGPSNAASAGETPRVTLFELLRYAVQRDHSPSRVVDAAPGVRLVTHGLESNLSHLYRHADAAHLTLTAQSMWSGSGLYVTAIRIRNHSAQPLTFDPRRMQHAPGLNGAAHHFVASAMVRSTLSAAGSRQAEAFVYIVTDRPFASVVGQP